MKIAITGGAGFIGKHIIQSILNHKSRSQIKVLDSFDPQVHEKNSIDNFINQFPKVDLRVGDICEISDVNWLIEDVDILIHLAAQTGTGQSMYEINRYTRDNVLGTANILQCMLDSNSIIKKFILASSRSIYGEGQYEICSNCFEHNQQVVVRSEEQLRNKNYEPQCYKCGAELSAIPTSENCAPNPLSYYAETKLIQERQVNLYKEKLFERFITFRFQNVYGEGQSLKNPYTGILAVFSTLAKLNQRINIFEDGLESRDFIHVHDIAETICHTIFDSNIDFDGVFNLGTGSPVSVLEVASKIKNYFDSSSELLISGDFRVGDIRHNYACMQKSNKLNINSKSFISFDQGLIRFLDSISDFSPTSSDYNKSIEELKRVGMFVSSNNE